MIGNDIVDIRAASQQSNWRRKGWIQKIFTVKEQNLIYTDQNPDQLVWKFWSMKESAYKAHQRYFNLFPVYNPKAFECDLYDIVSKDDLVYQTNSQINSNLIYTVASLKLNSEKVISQIFETDSISKNHFIVEISLQLSVPVSRLKIEKNENRIPQLFIDDTYVDLNFSFTSHGRFSAFVIENNI